MAAANPSIVVPKAAPPSHDDVAQLSSAIYTSKTSQESLDSAYALTDLLTNSVGHRGLTAYNVLTEVKAAAADKKNAARREGAMFALGALLERFPSRTRLSEVVFLLQVEYTVPTALDALADKGSNIREGARFALDALFDNLGAEAKVQGLLPVLQTYLGKSTGKWQGTVGAFELIGRMADKASMGMGSAAEETEKDVLRHFMGKKLQFLIPIVEAGMHDLKSEVAKTAIKTMNSLTTLLENDDVASKIPLLIQSMEQPSTESLQKAIHALSQTTFVAEVTSPVLALLTPLLERSLNTPTTTQEVTRQTVIVVENLTKLVHDPIEARVFLPKLRPGVENVEARASLPEVREIAHRASEVIKTAMGEQSGDSAAVLRTSSDDVAEVLDREIKSHGGLINYPGDAELWKLASQYVCTIVAEDVNQRQIQRIKQNVALYIQPLLADNTAAEQIAAKVHAHFFAEDERKFGAPPAPEDGEVEIVDATFSLGYGGKLLLSHTNLRLLKGHRYGLIGRNGAGKSTLMRSIANGKLEGYPPQDEVRSIMVEHNQGEDADLSILDYCLNDPEIAKEGSQRVSEVLEEVGFTSGPEGRQGQKVGTLSGGWKMKLALARAMLVKAAVYLLDEPTNHLSQENVQWLQGYLNTHPEITSLIVSHDSAFLDAVCTDIYHYETKKLVRYRGNLADFVKLKPEAKAYYTLSDSQLAFKFPPPGILTGVKSNTRSILRMTDCTFTYPSAPKPSLYNVSCQLTLSSRVAVLGANGAGKSTLIKVLTGEVIPNTGKVEKHPNLRIGYIKQHALEHVEMHMEKTPLQYIMWRYAGGDDREVRMKQTRKLTAEDQAQMEKWVDLPGLSPRRIELLIGRQKHKKSFQYEVKWVGFLPKYNSMVSRETLLELGFQKLIQEFDDHEASREGLGFRILEPKVIMKHFDDIGLDSEIAAHQDIGGLSGGQKVKVVLAGAMWNNPHLLILDEPTNFLDRDSIGGLAVAIRDWKGGVLMITHNPQFYEALASEIWNVDEGRLTSKQLTTADGTKFEDTASTVASSGPPTPRLGLASGLTSGAASGRSSAIGSEVNSAVQSEAEGKEQNMEFRARKKKKLTRAQLKDREARRRLRHINWLSSPKGTPKPADTDDEA